MSTSGKFWFTFAARVCRILLIIILFLFHIFYPWTWSCPLLNLFYGLCFLADFLRHVCWIDVHFSRSIWSSLLGAQIYILSLPLVLSAGYFVFQVYKIQFVNKNCCLHCVYVKLHLIGFNKLQHCSTWLSWFLFLLLSTCTHDNFRT